MSSAYRKLSARNALWFEIHARVRTDLMQSLVGGMQGKAQQHVADGILAALDPRARGFAERKAQVLRQQAAALDLSTTASRNAAFALRQVQRTKRKLTDGE